MANVIWNGIVPFIYIYRTGRTDGFPYCVGRILNADAPVEGSVALFANLDDASMFITAYASSTGAMVSGLSGVTD